MKCPRCRGPLVDCVDYNKEAPKTKSKRCLDCGNRIYKSPTLKFSTKEKRWSLKLTQT